MTSEIKPAVFARGVPAAAKNGIYGMEVDLVASPGQFIAVVVYDVDDVIDKTLKGERYPVISVKHIEPLHKPDAIEAAQKLLAAALEVRGPAELDMPEEPEIDFDEPLEQKPTSDAEAAKRGKK